MSDPTFQERRKHSRITFSAPATLLVGDRTLEASILDLSLKGALVQLAGGTVEDRATCTLHIRFDEPLAEIVMETRVVRVTGACVGLLCLSMDLDSITHLRRLVEFNLGNQELLERELSVLVDDSPAA